jgi:hypothetical protein
MTDKSYVTLERKVCPACGIEHNSGAILMDNRMRDRFEPSTVTGWGLCDDDAAKVEEGFVILVGANAPDGADTLTPSNADRTGDLMYLRREVAENMFNIPEVPDMVFVAPEVVDMLKKMAAEAENADLGEDYDLEEEEGA